MMNKLFFLISLSLLSSFEPGTAGTKTNGKAFVKAVDKLMAMSFQSDSLGLLEITNELGSFTREEDLAYLAHYYIAFGKWQSVLRQSNVSAGSQDAIQTLYEAIAELETAIKLKEDFADAYALSLNCHYPLYYLQPEGRRELAPKVAALKAKALELGPENPRVVLTDAQNIFYTPEQFGGSQEKGIARYQEAIRLFQEQPKPRTPLPNWGHEMAYAWLGNAYLYLQQPDVQKAKQAFETSLKLRPDFAWVRDTMLPRVKGQISENSK